MAFLLAAAEVVAIVVSLGDQAVAGAQSVFTAKNLIATIALVIVGAVSVAVGGILIVAPLLGWQGSGREPPRRNAARR